MLLNNSNHCVVSVSSGKNTDKSNKGHLLVKSRLNVLLPLSHVPRHLCVLHVPLCTCHESFLQTMTRQSSCSETSSNYHCNHNRAITKSMPLQDRNVIRKVLCRQCCQFKSIQHSSTKRNFKN